MNSVAILLTTYNRKALVQDAIRSVLEQDCDRWRLYILDDGSNNETRAAITLACGQTAWCFVDEVAGGIVVQSEDGRIVWWRGPDRPMAERKSRISYSRSINIALNYLLQNERYVCYLCDDDQYYPESIRVRAEFLDTHPNVHVVYGRSRSVQYARGGFNKWDSAAPPKAGRFYPRPDGERVLMPGGLSARHYFAGGKVDPETQLPYVEEAFFLEGPSQYGKPGMIDHNSFMTRRECLTDCREWPVKADGTVEYWGEDLSWGVGDAAHLTLLGAVHEFWGIREWVVSKKYHGLSDGVAATEVRE